MQRDAELKRSANCPLETKNENCSCKQMEIEGARRRAATAATTMVLWKLYFIVDCLFIHSVQVKPQKLDEKL